MNNKSIVDQLFGDRKIIIALLIISSIILHPSSLLYAQHTRLYACVIGSDSIGASMGGSSLGSGLWQSDDTAKTWKQLGWKHVKCYSVDIVNKSNGKIIYEACGNGVMRSTDAGATWRMLTDSRITEVMDIAIDQKDTKNIYIASPEAIWKSVDGGDSWSEADSDIPEPRFISRIMIFPRDHKIVYAATETGLYDSQDGGMSWKKIRGSLASVRDMTITIHGAETWVDDDGGFTRNGKNRFVDSHGKLWSVIENSGQYIIGGTKGAYSIDDEKHLQTFLQSPKNVHSLVLIDSILFMGSLDGGVWKNDLKKGNITAEKCGLEYSQVWRLKSIEIK
jgi:hypothetical protein